MLGWDNVRISIAGARLSFLVQYDNVWDHGSLIEHVKTVYHISEKAVRKGDSDLMVRYLSENASELNKKNSWPEQFINRGHRLEKVSIIGLSHNASKNDRFTALLELQRIGQQISGQSSQVWLFVRSGNLWLLDKIKPRNTWYAKLLS